MAIPTQLIMLRCKFNFHSSFSQGFSIKGKYKVIYLFLQKTEYHITELQKIDQVQH